MTARDENLVVAGRRLVADTVMELDLCDPRGARLPDWTPGAHIDLVLPGGRVRQYSLCGDRWRPDRYRVAVLAEPDGRGGSRAVHEDLRLGDRVGYGGPRNTFRLVPAREYLFVAGGIGITPLLPMLDTATRLETPWTLLYAGRRRRSMAYVDEVRSLEAAGAGLGRVLLFPGDEAGRLPLAGRVGVYRPGRAVYACGPTRLLSALADHCAGWPQGSVHTERFVAEEIDSTEDRAFEVELAHDGRILTVPPGSSVLDTLTGAGVGVLSSCARGLCGTCEVGVLGGVPDHRDSLLTDHERRDGRSMFVCVSRSRTPRLVLDL